MRSFLTHLLVNAAVFVGLLVFGAAIFSLIPGERGDDVRKGRAALPNYDGSDWAPKLFAETGKTDFVYYSYIEWRRRPFAGEMVNVIGEYGERLTAEPANPRDETVFFFGGSTLWGTGSRDFETIPSQFAIESGLRARNFGESAYTAHQGLEMMIKLFQAGERPAAIVFYDGVNDVAHKCRSELGPYSDANEMKARLALEPSGFIRFFWGIVAKIATLFSEQQIAKGYDCDSNPQKAEAIANALVSDWKIAAATADLYGIRFYAILQPVVYFSHTRTDYLGVSSDDEQARQFQAIYPRVRALMAGTPFRDFTDAFDRDEFIYIDFCHVSPNGNALIADRIAKLVAPNIPVNAQ